MLLHTNNMKKGMTHLYFPSIDPRACFKLHSHIVTLQPPALPYSLPVPDLPGLPANNIRALLFPGALHKAAGPKVGKLLACRPPAVMHPHTTQAVMYYPLPTLIKEMVLLWSQVP